MATMFSPEYQWLWIFALGVALFFPVRQLIWVMSVRRFHNKTGELPGDDISQAMKRRAAVTSALMCFVFSVVYVNNMFIQQP